MAKEIESSKGFKLIEATRADMFKIGSYGICDSCSATSQKGVYVAVLNAWQCEECFQDWHRDAVNYSEDKKIEERNFKAYKNILIEK